MPEPNSYLLQTPSAESLLTAALGLGTDEGTTTMTRSSLRLASLRAPPTADLITFMLEAELEHVQQRV